MKKNSENSGRNKIDGFEEYGLRRKRRTIWTAAGCVLAALMVVGISFAMRSQGRALTGDDSAKLTCGITEEHTHVDGCREPELICGKDEHEHDDDCYGEPKLMCGIKEEYTHNDSCYDESNVLICGNEAHTHTHDDNCYEPELICGKDEHEHNDDCYGEPKLICGKDEHEHNDDCYANGTGTGEEQQPTGPKDITSNVTKVVFYKGQGEQWVETGNSFNSDDSVRAEFKCSNIPVSELKNRVYVLLPGNIPFPEAMVGENKAVVYIDKEYGKAGKYWLSDTDGEPGKMCAVFESDSGYLKWLNDKNRSIANLEFGFEFKWDVKLNNGEEEKRDIYINGYAGTVIIKGKNESSNPNQNSGYSAYKNVKETKYDDNGKILITYEIYVNVGSHQDEMIKLNDEITCGTEFYNLEWQYSGNGGKHDATNDYVKLSQESDKKKTITIGDGKGVDAGTYTIRYTASFDVGELQNAKVNSIANAITGDNNIYSRTETYTNTNLMTKSGNVTNVSAGEVEWTVWINDGGTLYTFGKDELFTDTLPAGTSLVDGKIEIFQYGANWNLIESWSVKQQDGATLITATLPKGTYRYQIKYKTVQDTPPQPGVDTKVVNKAEISGDIQFATSAEVTLKPPAITKTMVDVLTKSQQFYTKPDGTRLPVFEIEWFVTLASVKADEEYIDEGLSWAVPLLMSPKQIEGIVVKCGETPLVKDKDYVITQPDSNGNFLFKIKFLTTQKDKVTIDYTCYADVTNVAGDGFNVYNVFGGVQAGGWISNKFKSQSTNLFKYVKGSDANESNRITNSKIAIGTGKTLNWVIVAEPKYNPDTPLVFEDTLPKGLSFVDGSLKITAEWNIDIDSQYYQYQIDKDTNVITLTVDLANKKVGWKDFSDKNQTLDRLVITYDTLISNPADGGQSKDYTNTVEWDGNKVEQNVTVTRDVIGKNGSFDENTGMLRYSVIINPDGADLNPGGDLLRVEDTLTGPSGIKFKLDGVTLYSLTNASDGSGNKVPGSKVAELQLLPDKPAGDGSVNTYYYDDKTYTFTAFISDNTGYALVYDYQITSKLKDDIEVRNKVSLYGGSNSYGSTQVSTRVLSYAVNASISTEAVNLRLEKRDEDYHDTLLAGAEFTVSGWDEAGGEWVDPKLYKTDENGSVALSSIKPGVLYKVMETKAPDKYAINEEIKYFMFVDASAAASVPDGVSIPDGVKKEDITIYQYGEDIPASVMEWTDKRLGTTDILVKKEWQDGSGDPITWDNGELKFDLYRKKVSKDPDYIEGRTYIYELTDKELEIIKVDYEGYKASHKDEYVDEYTLASSSNGEWELLIKDLEQTDETGENVYQYYLVETSMGVGTLSESDYWMGVKYKNTSGTVQNQAEITVTNTIVSDYSLPETGAEGTWTDRIKGWFQERYQKIVNYFRKG